MAGIHGARGGAAGLPMKEGNIPCRRRLRQFRLDDAAFRRGRLKKSSRAWDEVEGHCIEPRDGDTSVAE